MAARYLLDTNILSRVASEPHGPTAARLLQAGEGRLCTSIIVSCELKFGLLKKGSARLTAQVEAVLAVLPVLPLGGEVDERYARLRHALEKKGQPIGQNDLLIAAHALTLDAVLVSENEREFRKVPGLRVENWSPRR